MYDIAQFPRLPPRDEGGPAMTGRMAGRGILSIALLLACAVPLGAASQDSGPIDCCQVELRLRQDGVVVAEGTASWTLEGDVEWTAEVDRTPYPDAAFVNEFFADHANPVPCYWFWCHDTWRFDIAEHAVNYEGESLWLTVWWVHPGECADVC